MYVSLGDVGLVDLAQYLPAVVACALKVCLVDVRQSVLPETMYDRFIDAVGMSFKHVCNVSNKQGFLRTAI